MEEEGRGPRLSKRFSDKDGEVDYKTKAGTAWSHSYLNQKPWHPLSYPNQRRKWIAEQQHAQRERRVEEVAREYAQEQEFFRQTALISKKEKEKVEMMQAVSFMYVRPPGYNAESAKAAEISDEQKKLQQTESIAEPSSSMPQEPVWAKDEKKNPRRKDVFGRPLPTEQEFEVLKNAPRLDTGVAGRAKPFAVEVRNVKCVRCGNFGHQSGDRECPLKDVIMPNEENRLKRDDPLNAILAHADASEPLKWELKQKPGLSPPRGGFDPDDPNQQIVAEEIFDEYGGFLTDGAVPQLLASFHSSKHKKKSKRSKHKKHHSSTNDDLDDDDDDDKRRNLRRKEKKSKHKKHHSSTDDDDYGDDENRKKLRSKEKKSKHKKHHSSVDDDDNDDGEKGKKLGTKEKKCRKHHSSIDDDDDGNGKRKKLRKKEKKNKHKRHQSSSDDDERKKLRRFKSKKRHDDDFSAGLLEGLELERHNQERGEKSNHSFSSKDHEPYDGHDRRQSSSRHGNSGSTSHCMERSPSSYVDDSERRLMKEERHKMKSLGKDCVYDLHENPELGRHCKRIKRRNKHSCYI